MDRVAVLPDEQHPLVVVEREHGDGSGVVDQLADDRPVVVLEPLARDVPDAALDGSPSARAPVVLGDVGDRAGAGGSGIDGVQHVVRGRLEAGRGRLVVEQATRALPVERRADQPAEQRMRPGRPAASSGCACVPM